MDVFDDGTDDGRKGQPLQYFLNHPTTREAKLLEEHVVALRLYTTAVYVLINSPLRTIGAEGGEPHPLPVTVAYITDGISRLRATYANLPDASAKKDFWRG